MGRWVVPLLFTATAVSATSNMIFKKIDVQMGAVGSDDDVRIKICDLSKCCTTKELSNTFGSEWKAKKLETWDGSDLGNCSSILFDDKLSSIEVTILKALSKKDALEVTSMVLSGQIGSDKKKVQMFECGSYKFSNKDAQKSNFCLKKTTTATTKRPAVTTKRPVAKASSATSNMIFKKIDVQMGAVGSDDDIRIRICDLSKCCTTKKLSHLIGSEWKAKKLETWDGSDLGNCSSILFNDKLSSIEVSILKALSKKDALEVTSMVLSAQVGSDKKKVQKFKCGSYRFSAKDEQKSNFCLNEKSSPKATTTKKPTVTTKRPVAKASSGLPNLLIKKINVQVGAVGTDDDVTMKICDLKRCCTTSKLSHTLSSEWVKNKLESWDGRKLGNCSDILFTSGASSIEVSVIKTNKKKKPLEITSIVLEASPTSDKKKTEKFKCGTYKFGASDTQKSNFCLNKNAAKTGTQSRTTPAEYKVNNVVVQMGDDGTNDDVSLEICNAKSALKCCDTGKLSGLLSNDWSKNDKETWKNKDLGLCKTTTFDACKGFDVAVKKKSGKDSLKVSTITLEVADKNDAKKSQKFVCSSYNVGASDTIKRNSCTLDSSSTLSCPKTSSLTTRRPSATTKRTVPPPKPSSGPVTGKPPLFSDSENIILKGFEVQVGGGTNDGTKDTVTAKICSADKKTCCETPQLSKRSGNNWVRNGNVTLPGTSLGLCKDKVFKTKARTTISNLLETNLVLTLNRIGKDGMRLESFYLDAETAVGSQKRRFKCGKIAVELSNKGTKECYAQFPKKSVQTPRKPATTTRPPFRSGSG
eukprot:GFUD01012812.1.p1 GENE.GFUD01012812.1~~GFUD01012812.1.p1  ORF type:complete len:810 (+),score=226.03 GFUD01012812.1:149-2578(+)